MDIQITKDNFCAFGYDGHPFGLRANREQRFFVKYGPCRRPSLDWRSECITAAREIASLGGEALRVCMSGGIDSEIVAESFRYARVPFEVIIMRLDRDQNIHDYSWAIAYCERFGIKYSFYDLDTETFFSSPEYRALSEELTCFYPGIVLQMKMALDLCRQKLFPVIGAGDLHFQLHNRKWSVVQNEYAFALSRLQIKFKLNGVFRFYHWSPELLESFILSPVIQDMINLRIHGLVTHDPIRYQILKQFFDIQYRPKYFGYEKFSARVRELSQAWAKSVPAKGHLHLQAIQTDILPALAFQRAPAAKK